MNYTLYALLTVAVTATTGQAQSVTALKNWLAQSTDKRAPLTTAALQKPLSKGDADEATTLLLADQQRQQADKLRQNWTDKLLRKATTF